MTEEQRFNEAIRAEELDQAKRRLASRANAGQYLGQTDWTPEQMIVCGPLTLADAVDEGLFRRVDPKHPRMVVHTGLWGAIRANVVRELAAKNLSALATSAALDEATDKIARRQLHDVSRLVVKENFPDRIDGIGCDALPGVWMVGVINDEGGLSLMRAEDE